MLGFWLTIYQDYMGNEEDYVELGLLCAEVCDALCQELKGTQEGDLNPSTLRAVGQLAT